MPSTRHRCFISYHHADEAEVRRFIDTFDHFQDLFIARGIGASMPGDVINSMNADYIKQRIRDLYLSDSTVTIVMVGRCTWSRRFVDWEIAASLRNTANSNMNGLMAIQLPSGLYADLPIRFKDNWSPDSVSYAKYQPYPDSGVQLQSWIEDAFESRTRLGVLADNSRSLFAANRQCP